MYKENLRYLIPFTVLPIAIFSLKLFSPIPWGSTTFWWIMQFLILIIFLISKYNYFKSYNKKYFQFLDWYLIWITFSLIRGVFIAEIYWDYKALITNLFALYIPLIAYIVTDNKILQSVFSFFIKYTLPLSLPLLFIFNLAGLGWYLYPLSFLLIFVPILNLHWKVILVSIAMVVMFADLSARSQVIKYGMPLLLLIIYYARFFDVSNAFLNILSKVFMITPWVLFILGVSGIFNVFNLKDYVKINYVAESTNNLGETRTQEITDDSRTFIYTEVLQSALKYNYWFLGRSPARGNETVAFGKKMEEITGREERYRNEANVPNIFTWLGVIGVFLYFLVFYKATSLSINQSNNIYSKLIGLYISFRWMYAWVEDPAMFGMNEFTIWLMIGVCLSESFREMNNSEVKLWVRGIFNKEYVLAYKAYQMSK
jgi:hypothetical protein